MYDHHHNAEVAREQVDNGNRHAGDNDHFNIPFEYVSSFASNEEKNNNNDKKKGEGSTSNIHRTNTIRGSKYRGNPLQQPNNMNNKLLYKDSDLRKFSSDDFDFGPKIGKGKYGDVFLCRHKKSNFIMAIKVLDKMVLKQMRVQRQLVREIKFHWFLKHKNIIPLYGVFHDDDKVYMMMEYASKGDVYKELKMAAGKRFEEQKASNYIKQILDAVIYLHSQDIIHRDLKPENLLDCDGTIKLADFGWSVLAPEKTGRRKTFCGTLDYMPPEMIHGEKYDGSIDNWSIGVLAYEFIVGTPPFAKESQKETFESIVNIDFSIPSHVSHDAVDFIRGLLEKDPSKRISLSDALNHTWISKYNK